MQKKIVLSSDIFLPSLVKSNLFLFSSRVQSYMLLRYHDFKRRVLNYVANKL